MKFLELSVFIVLGICFTEAANPKWKPLVCRDKLFVPHLSIMKQLEACADPKVYGPESKQPNCRLLCQADIFGLLDKTGIFTPEIYTVWVDETFPDQYKDVGKAHFDDCYEKFGKNIDYKSGGECNKIEAYMSCKGLVTLKMPC